MRVLFVLKKAGWAGYSCSPTAGLFNSASFVCDMVREKLGLKSKLVVVQDNNDIDREVTKYRPDVVIIEAVWIVPHKFEELRRRHPRVRWIVRNHSAMPFLAHEGNALDWMFRYVAIPNVDVACNDPRPQAELQAISEREFLFLPNYYPTKFFPRDRERKDNVVNIGCFGAIRTLKNQLLQAVAAIRYADAAGKELHFHINSTRVENVEAHSILKNIRALFAEDRRSQAQSRHKLIEHGWLERAEFIRLVRRMDVGLQCSYSETFNIIAADFVMNDVPVVVSPEISWVADSFQVDPNDSQLIAAAIGRALRRWKIKPHRSAESLVRASKRAVVAWAKVLMGPMPGFARDLCSGRK